MGRQRLYHTAEEKLAANRAKSRRHYEKYASHFYLFIISLMTIPSLELKIRLTSAGEKSIRKRIKKKRGEYWPLSSLIRCKSI